MVIVLVFLTGRSPCEELADVESARKARLEFIQRTFAEFQLLNGEKVLAAKQQPVLRYSNPVRNFFSDGATFPWLEGKRPAAAGTVSVRGVGKVYVLFQETAALRAWGTYRLDTQIRQCRPRAAAAWARTGRLVQASVAATPASGPAVL